MCHHISSAVITHICSSANTSPPAVCFAFSKEKKRLRGQCNPPTNHLLHSSPSPSRFVHPFCSSALSFHSFKRYALTYELEIVFWRPPATAPLLLLIELDSPPPIEECLDKAGERTQEEEERAGEREI